MVKSASTLSRSTWDAWIELGDGLYCFLFLSSCFFFTSASLTSSGGEERKYLFVLRCPQTRKSNSFMPQQILPQALQFVPGAQNAAQSFIKPFFLATRLFRYFATFRSLFLSRPFLSLRSPSLSIYFTRYSRFPFYLRCGPPVWGRACSFSGSRDYGEGARQPLVSDQFFFFLYFLLRYAGVVERRRRRSGGCKSHDLALFYSGCLSAGFGVVYYMLHFRAAAWRSRAVIAHFRFRCLSVPSEIDVIFSDEPRRFSFFFVRLQRNSYVFLFLFSSRTPYNPQTSFAGGG